MNYQDEDSMTQWSLSKTLLERSKRSLAGGVSSNVRANAKPHPLFFERGAGATLYDVDGNRYIDYVVGQGPLILGHSPPAVLDSVHAAIDRGQLYAGQHRLEIDLAEILVRLIPCAELCRFSLSGSEAVQAALRLARAVTGRNKFLRFEGHYHGWFDNVLLNVATPLEEAGPRERPRTVPATAGQAQSVLDDCVVLPWNDLACVEALFSEIGETIAAVITEPMMCNTGAIQPKSGYLEGLRHICDETGALLIMDEVITGFRLGLQGAQGHFGVVPDLATFGKAMAGGFPCSALVGKKEFMERFAHDVNHSGTFNSNVMSMAASTATIAELEQDDGAVYRRMEENGNALMNGIQDIAQRLGLSLLVQGLPTAFHLAFTDRSTIEDYRSYTLHCDTEQYHRFAVAMLRHGIRLTDRGIWYISAAHDQTHIEQTLEAVEASLEETEVMRKP